MPFVGWEARHNEQRERDEHVGGEHIEPDIHVQGRHEREQFGRHRRRQFEEDADTQIHERLREVNNTLSSIVDRHCSDGQIGVLIDDLAHKAIPFAGGRVLGTELVEW